MLPQTSRFVTNLHSAEQTNDHDIFDAKKIISRRHSAIVNVERVHVGTSTVLQKLIKQQSNNALKIVAGLYVITSCEYLDILQR